MTRYVLAVVLGAILGYLGPRYQSIGWFSLIPWGIVGLALGYWSPRNERVFSGLLYGFALCFAFMIAAYTGTAPLASRLPFFVVVGIFGAICGLALTLIGNALRARRATSTPPLQS